MRRILGAAALLVVADTALAQPPALTLAVPTGPAPTACAALDAPPTAPVALAETFRDDFDAFDPYGGRWTPHFDHNRYGDWHARTLTANGEAQVYVDPRYQGDADRPLGLDPFRAAGGLLTITARPTPEGLRDAIGGFAYVSGLISSRRSFLQRYGYFEIRARSPSAAGAWPAFWLLASGGRPPEIDVLETRGDEPDLHVRLHWREGGAHRSSGCRLPRPRSAGLHAYGVLWRADALVYYLDRAPVAWIRSRPGLDRPMYLLANLAVGGRWAGAPDGAQYPAEYAIDWIAAFQVLGGDVR
jgi:beta-glucanase (GH16 family)